MEFRVVISYRELANVSKLNSNKFDSIISHVKSKFELDSEQLEFLSAKLRLFHKNLNKKLVKCNQSFDSVMKDPWMHGKIEAFFKKKQNLKRKVGRPGKSFEECTERTKRRKIQEMSQNIPKDQLERAAIRSVNKPAAAKIVRQIMHSSAEDIKKYNAKATREELLPLTDTEAVSLLTELELGKYQYQSIRNVSKSRNADIFPPYHRVLAAKKLCYPDATSIEIDETSATIKLQALLDHTATRLLQSFADEEITNLPHQLSLLSKYGCDGASGQSQYKQAYKAGSEYISDSQVFITSLVPIRIVGKTNPKSIFWQNNRTGSPRYCRPIQFTFAKECKERTIAEIKKIKNQIKDLVPTMISIGKKCFTVCHTMFLSMVDGKTCQYITNTESSTTCVICKATPNEMNDIDRLLRKTVDVDESFYEFGLSPLHAKIRFMEFILHLGYNMPFEKWTASVKSGNAAKKEVSKKRIQDELWEKMKLRVDIVKQGSGTTNDGNTARRFFQDPKTVATVTLVEEEIIRRFQIILQTLSCGRDIDPEKFGKYAMDTYKKIVQKYNWYKMPWSVHRILMHGSDTIKHNILPIGQLTEEAAEARNKDFRRFREHHSRKINRTATNQDVLNCLLVSSDPLISNMRPLVKQQHLELLDEAKELLLAENNNNGETIQDD